MKTKTHVTKLLPLIGVFFALTTSKGLSQWIVEDPGAIAELTVANGLLGEIAANTFTTASQTTITAEETVKMNLFLLNNFGTVAQGLASKDSATTQAAITAAQVPVTGADKPFIQIVATGAAKGTVSATGNQTVLGKQLYTLLPKMPPASPAALKLPTLMRKYSAVEEAVNNYYLIVDANKLKIAALEKDLSLKMTSLNAAMTPAQVDKINASINAIHTQITALKAENESAANHVKVLALSNENNDKKEADLASLKSDAQKMWGSLDGVFSFASKTW